MLGFKETSTLVGHFVLSPREMEKRDRRDSRGDERERQGKKRSGNESEETEETIGRPGNVRYTTPLPNPTTPHDQDGCHVHIWY